MRNRIINVLRWIAVLPASATVFCLVYAIGMLINYFTFLWSYTPGVIDIVFVIAKIFVNVYAGIAAIIVAAHVAPSGKYVTAIVLATLFCAWSIVCVVYFITTYHGIESIADIVYVVANAAGFVYGAIGAKDIKREIRSVSEKSSYNP